jgi:hypothetical protein
MPEAPEQMLLQHGTATAVRYRNAAELHVDKFLSPSVPGHIMTHLVSDRQPVDHGSENTDRRLPCRRSDISVLWSPPQWAGRRAPRPDIGLPGHGYGIAYADEIWFPLDPRRLLILGSPGDPLPEHACACPPRPPRPLTSPSPPEPTSTSSCIPSKTTLRGYGYLNPAPSSRFTDRCPSISTGITGPLPIPAHSAANRPYCYQQVQANAPRGFWPGASSARVHRRSIGGTWPTPPAAPARTEGGQGTLGRSCGSRCRPADDQSLGGGIGQLAGSAGNTLCRNDSHAAAVRDRCLTAAADAPQPLQASANIRTGPVRVISRP